MANKELRTVFVSHTSELAEYPQPWSFLDAARAGIEDAGCVPFGMEDYPSQDRGAADVDADYCFNLMAGRSSISVGSGIA